MTSLKNNGYTLTEMLLTVLLLSLLALIAVPSLQGNVNRSRFATVVQSAKALQPAVNNCMLTINKSAGCNSGTHGIPKPISNSSITQLSVKNAVITAIGANGAQQSPADTYILKGSINNDIINWTVGGSCVAHGTC